MTAARRFGKRSPGRFAVLCVTLLLAAPAFAISEKEKKQGKEEYDKITAAVPVYNNALVVDYVRALGQSLVKSSDLPDAEFTFTVLDSEDINAMATPGGYVYVNRGLLAYMDTEAELAAVISHEIAHVTERHSARQQRAGKLGSAASTIAAILVAIQTGSGMAANEVHSTGNVLGAAAVMGYGRDMELEADKVGARYMHKAGYDPQAMIDMLSVMKANEAFMKSSSRKEGRKPISYHGVFSSHPANDERLKEVVAAAGKLQPGEMKQVDAADFRKITDGMKFSEEDRAAAIVGNRYYNGKMGFTLAFPTDWKIVKRSSTVLSGPNRDSTILQMSVKNANAELTPAEFAAQELKLEKPREESKIESEEVVGSTALYANPRGGPDRRIAVLYFGSNAYVFEGRTGNAALAGFYDTMFLSTVRSFRPMNQEDRNAVLGINLHFIRAPEGITFAKLAEISPIKKYPEEMLRLVNGYYPNGEPQTGEWIKVFR